MASNVPQCDVCSEDGSYINAENWCSECQQWLCENCSKYHKRFSTTKSHVLMTTNDFNKIPKSMSQIERKCQKHPDNDLEFYCNDHIVVVCFSCLKNDHSSCKTINKVKDVARGVKSSAAVAELFSKIEDSIKIFKDLEADRLNQQGKLSKKTNLINSEIKALLSDLKKNLERAATDLQADLRSKSRDESTVLETQRELFTNKRVQLEQKLLEVKNVVTYASDVQVFLSLEKLNKEISANEEYLQDLDSKISTKTFDIKIDENVLRFIGTIRLFGKIIVQSEKCPVPLTGKNTAMVHIPHGQITTRGAVSNVISSGLNIQPPQATPDGLTFIRRFAIPKPRVRGNQNIIRDMKCLPNGYIAMTDMGNNRVVILDKAGSVMLEEQLSGNPRCLTFTRDGRVAVTMYDQKKVIVWNPYNPADKQTIDVDDYCTGIACLESCLVISRQRAGLLTINLDDDSRTKLPLYTGQINLCPYGDKSTVVCIHKAKTNDFILLDVLNGKEVAKFKIYSKKHSCVATDENDNFYIVDENSVRKIQVNKKTSEIILNSSNSIIKPQAVATYLKRKKSGYFFSNSTYTQVRILVANEDGNSICVYERK